MSYEDLLIEAEKESLMVREKPLLDSDGRIYMNRIAIRQDIPTYTGKACVLAEELGHHHTSSGDILDQTSVIDIRQERRARFWAYNRMIGLTGIISAFKASCRSKYEMAEHLEVSEEFLDEALECYRSKYGIYKRLDNYIIYFEPNLGVMELL